MSGPAGLRSASGEKQKISTHLLTDLVENWLNNDMIGETGMVDNFDVSLSSSFIRKKRPFLPDEARTERNVEVIYHSCLTNHSLVAGGEA